MKSMRIMIIKIMVSSFLHEYKCMKCNLLEPVYYSHGGYDMYMYYHSTS